VAEGRLLNKRVCQDRAVHALSGDTSRFLFVCTLPHLDRDGRVIGDPALLKALVAPRRDDISTEQMEAYIREWALEELVIWYEAAGERWLEFPSFRANQPNLRWDREPPSMIPCASSGHRIVGEDLPTVEAQPEDCRQSAGNVPDDIRQDARDTPAEDRRDTGEVPVSEVSREVRKEEGTRASARADSPLPVDNPDPPAREGPQFIVAYDFGKRYFAKTTRPFVPLEEHVALAAKLLRQLGGDQAAALEACRGYFDGEHWFTRDKRSGKPAYSFKGFVEHAAEVLAGSAGNGSRPRASPECPACGTAALGSERTCLRCGLDRGAWKDVDAVAEHKRYLAERAEAPA
jgi:hypothetical protein